MAENYTNTRDVMGDQAAFNALIAGTLEDLIEDGVTSIGSYGLYGNPGIKTIKFPNVTRLFNRSICECSNLTMLDIGKKCYFDNYSIINNEKLDSLILRGSAKSVDAHINTFNGTPLKFGRGGIFVPNDLVETYKQDSDWANYNIFPISEYPRSSWETISDTWGQIFAAEENGTYSSKYSIGDTKALTINNKNYYAQIVAFDADELSDNSGNYAKITWILKDLYEARHVMNSSSSNANGWPSTSMRSWLISTVLPQIPSDIRENIKEVKKTYYNRTTSNTLTSEDSIWIPSYREIFGSSSCENSGPTYTAALSTIMRKLKSCINENQVRDWWFRSAYKSDGSSFLKTSCTETSFNYNYSNASSTSYVCIGFCT